MTFFLKKLGYKKKLFSNNEYKEKYNSVNKNKAD